MHVRRHSSPAGAPPDADPANRVSASGVHTVVLLLALGTTLSCGGSPSAPGPPPPPPNPPPVISGIEIEPARVELKQEVTVRATVQDAETPAGSLTYEWAADGGTFTGSGATVTWRPPADAVTPADYVLRLTVIERYGDSNSQENRVTSNSPAVRVHDSPTELRDMSLAFLESFADSDVPADQCLVDFSDSCRGKESERRDIEENREYYRILSSSLDFDDVDISSDFLSAWVVVDCEFRSRVRKCPDNTPGCVVGAIERAKGECLLSAIYENRRWWLCDSSFDGVVTPGLRRFFGLR